MLPVRNALAVLQTLSATKSADGRTAEIVEYNTSKSRELATKSYVTVCYIVMTMPQNDTAEAIDVST